MTQIKDKIAKYDEFIETKLKKDLKDIELLLNLKCDKYKSWQELKNFAEHMAEQKVDEQVTTFEFGIGIYAIANIDQLDKVLVDIGCGYFLEMQYCEANKYIAIRMKYLKKEIDFFRQQAAHVKAHIKLVLLAINELKSK